MRTLVACLALGALAAAVFIVYAARRHGPTPGSTTRAKLDPAKSWATFSELLRNRIVYVGGDINDDTATVTIAQLLYLEDQIRPGPNRRTTRHRGQRARPHPRARQRTPRRRHRPVAGHHRARLRAPSRL